ncbi:hypothetical protein METHB2_780016 [Candidatus Methylobacter favarea]|uniref:Uncharacterized protein n=1 Tax=Candidatus Methylobacter favarea TaxID=2707345 RepID=A0A8S0XV85_9GAMM|nr:hypothetical protein [Candidatus Methylobacter favarea]CAA9892658.1 hypothetical protein METHB2_780016 [Candidatus Methylobacter favarea]
MNLKPTKSHSIESSILALGSGKLTEPRIIRHIRPLFSRSLQYSRDVIYLANPSLGRALDQTENDVKEGLGYWYTDRERAWSM